MASPSPSPDDERVSIGSVLDGRYRIDAVLGSGGMGRVYRGEHTGIGRAVAIKVLHADLNRNRDASARFQREALASGRLDHPNIVGVSDFGVLDDGSFYLVMEALEGESLGDRLAREKRIPWPDALEIMRGMLRGLGHAHERGVVHRDIKPDNVFLARKDREHVVKILDFGIAKLYAGSADDPASTRAGLTVGTPAYLSPEQAVGGEITPASDIYSSTIVLFEMLAGRPPWQERDALAMLGAHVSRTPPTLFEVAPDLAVPPGIEELLQRGLVKAAASRISSAAEYLQWIDAIAASTSAPPGSLLGVMPTASVLPVVCATPIPGYATPAPGYATPAPGYATPVPGYPTPAPGYATPAPGYATPAPDSLSTAGPSMARAGTNQRPMEPMAPVSGNAATMSTESVTVFPLSTRAVSLAEVGEPIPKRWLMLGGIGFAALLVIAAVLAGVSGGSEPTKPTKPAKPAAPAPAVRPEPAAGRDVTADRDTRLKAALHDLTAGKDCPARRSAIPKLVELDDPAAIPALQRARYRMRGGILGVGDDNTNACLTKDADAAIKQLTPRK